MANEVHLLWQGGWEPDLVSVHASRRAAWQAALRQRYAEAQEAFNWSRVHGRREYGEWWETVHRRHLAMAVLWVQSRTVEG